MHEPKLDQVRNSLYQGEENPAIQFFIKQGDAP